MLIISEKTPPKSSYQNILKNPLTKQIFISTLSQLGIQGSTKEAIISEFNNTINDFRDFSYTGDINYFKVGLYTTLDEINKDISLIDVLSTEEFIETSTKAIENIISISITDDKVNVSLDEYIKIIRRKGSGTPHILPVLRGLYRLEPNCQIHRDTSELVAALKKHLIINSTSDSTLKLSSLVEANKQNEIIMREDELHYNNIKSYINDLPENFNDYSHMMDEIKSAIEYFSNSNDYKKEKLDNLMNIFLTNLTKCGLSQHGRKYGYLGSDVFSIEYKEKLDINDFVVFLNKHPEYKDLVINIMNGKKIELKNSIMHRKESINNFYRPTREERCSRAPYRGSIIKSDQEYGRELDNLRLKLDMDEKNFALFKSYLLKIV